VTAQFQQIGRYEIIREISRSGIAVVYLAKDPRLDREVVIKLVLPGRELSNEFQANFRLASKDLAQLSHANIIKVLDFGEQDGSPFIVMEHIKNGSLADRIGQPMHWQEAVRIITPIAHALDYAHSENLIHRDLKPNNILFTDEDQPIITDLNFVALVEDEETRDFTSTTVGMGRPEYMSPEQGKGINIDHRADIYSLGIILYELITGQKPFTAENPMEIVIKQVTTPPPDPRKFVSNIPLGLVQIIMKALSKDPEERYPDMALFAKDLEKFLKKNKDASKQHRGRKIKIFAITGTILALAIIGILVGSKRFTSATVVTSTINVVTPTEKIISTPNPEIAPADIDPTATIPPTEQIAEPTEIVQIADLYPLIPGESLPTSLSSITTQNVNQMVELARWGRPKLTDVVWSPDNTQIVASTSNGVYFFDAGSLELLRILDFNAWMTAIDISSNGNILAAGDNLGQIQIIDFASGKTISTLQGHTSEITSLSFSPDSSMLLSGSKDKTATLWHVDSGTLAYTLADHLLPINSVQFSDDGTTAITGSEDFRINLWDTNTGNKINTMTGKSQVHQLALSPDQKTLATALRNSTVQFWNIETNKAETVLQDRKLVQAVNTLSFSPNGQLILSGAADSTIRLWQAATGEELWETSGAKDPEHIDKTLDEIFEIAFSPDGNKFISVTEEGYMAIWDVGSQSIIKSNEFLWQKITHLTFSPNTKYLAVHVEENHVEVWNTSNGRIELSAEGTLPRGNPFSSNGNQIAIQTAEKEISIYSLISKKSVATLQGYSSETAVSFLGDNKFLGASTNKKLTLWSVRSGQELEFLNSEFEANCQVVYNVDGSLLAAGSKIGMLQTPEAVGEFCNIRRSTTVLDEDFLPAGNMLALSTNNQRTIFWDHLDTKGEENSLTGHTGKVYGVGISPDGGIIATAGEDHKIHLWNTSNIESPLLTLETHYAPVLDVDFSTDGKFLVTSSIDGAVQIWGIIQ